MDFEHIKETFEEYANSFDTEDKRKELKIYHTYEVAKISETIAYNLGLSKENIELAKLIGYLHDVGRFPQLVDTHSFKDTEYDHAKKGVEVLFKDGLIRKFIKTKKYDDIIKFSIANHNKLNLPKKMTREEELFGKLIRDADKIDIYRVCAAREDNEFLLEPSPKVLEDILRGDSVNMANRKGKSDSTLCILAFVNDLNYVPSIMVLQKKGYFNKYVKSIKVSEEQEETFNKVVKVCRKKMRYIKNVR